MNLRFSSVTLPIQNVHAPSLKAVRGAGGGEGAAVPASAAFRLRPLQPRGRSTPTMSSSVGAMSMFCASSVDRAPRPRHPRRGDHERRAHDAVVVRLAVADHAVLVELLAVVGVEDDDRLLREPATARGRQRAAPGPRRSSGCPSSYIAIALARSSAVGCTVPAAHALDRVEGELERARKDAVEVLALVRVEERIVRVGRVEKDEEAARSGSSRSSRGRAASSPRATPARGGRGPIPGRSRRASTPSSGRRPPSCSRPPERLGARGRPRATARARCRAPSTRSFSSRCSCTASCET